MVDGALAAYASVALLCAAAIVVGQAILSLCGRVGFTWLSGPVGLAAMLVCSGIAIKLPGHGTAVAIVLLALVAAAIVVLVLRADAGGFVESLATGAWAALAALLIASIPFVVNGRVGILGVGLVNDDMAYHLLIADWLSTRVGDMPVLIHQAAEFEQPTLFQRLKAAQAKILHVVQILDHVVVLLLGLVVLLLQDRGRTA